MKYNKPSNATDANAPYVDTDPQKGIKGSTVPAAAIEAPQRELVNLIIKGKQTPSADDMEQVYKAILQIIKDNAFSSVGDGLDIDDEGVLKAVITNGLVFSEGKLALNLHDSLALWNSQVGVAYLVSLSKAEDMTDNIIQPQVTRTILRKTITEATTFTFDNTAIADIPDNTHVTLELHLNMQTVSAIAFNPAVEWDGGEAPDLSETNKDYWLVLRTENKGASWKACLGSTFNGYSVQTQQETTA